MSYAASASSCLPTNPNTGRQVLRYVLDRPFSVDELSAGLSNETFLAAQP